MCLPSNTRSLGGSTVLDEVKRVYNDFGQMTREYQEHDGAVDGSSLHVDYAYANPSGSTTPNTTRKTSITYPNSTTISTDYGSGTPNALSRPSALKEGSTVLASYKFLGLSTNVEVKYNAANNALLTYQSGGTESAGDKYTGLDRFGRLIETIWKRPDTPTDAVLVHSTYGRSRFGGVTWRRDDLAHSMNKDDQDNYYWYDGLYRVQQHQRGNLNAYHTGIESPPAQDETWAYDAMGNWLAYDNDALSQSRTHNNANEITSIAEPENVVQPGYDNAGNMTVMPKVGAWAMPCTLRWDAWNRLAAIEQGEDDPIGYHYDALGRRILVDASTAVDAYYDDQWRSVLETSGSSELAEYIWGTLDRWDMVCRRWESGASHYVLKDYLDPVAILADTGYVIERYRYSAFGETQIMDSAFMSQFVSDYAWTFLFHAEFRDEATKLYNYGYRYYCSSLGRWMSRDPLATADREQLYNLYDFCGNSAMAVLDRLGLTPEVWSGWTPDRVSKRRRFRIQSSPDKGVIQMKVYSCEIIIVNAHGDEHTPHVFNFGTGKSGTAMKAAREGADSDRKAAFLGCYAQRTMADVDSEYRLSGEKPIIDELLEGGLTSGNKSDSPNHVDHYLKAIQSSIMTDIGDLCKCCSSVTIITFTAKSVDNSDLAERSRNVYDCLQKSFVNSSGKKIELPNNNIYDRKSYGD